MRIAIHKTIMILQFIFLCNIGSIYCQDSKKEFRENNISKMTISYEDFYIETPFRINCKNFYSYFNKTFKTKVVQNPKIITKLINYINEARIDYKKAFKVDVRYKIKILYSDGKIIEVCGNESVIEIDGEEHCINKNFSNYLKILLK